MKEKHPRQWPMQAIFPKQKLFSWPTEWRRESNHTRVIWCLVLVQVSHSKYQLLPSTGTCRRWKRYAECLLIQRRTIKIFLNKTFLFNFSFQPHSADSRNKTELAEAVINEALWNKLHTNHLHVKEREGAYADQRDSTHVLNIERSCLRAAVPSKNDKLVTQTHCATEYY